MTIIMIKIHKKIAAAFAPPLLEVSRMTLEEVF
jgi:hypothetical protein